MSNIIAEIPFSCETCGYKTRYKNILYRHLKRHSAKKPSVELFSCETCDYRTRHKNSLIRHFKIHSDEKPFTCHTCGFRTKLKFSLIKHFKTHQAPLASKYKCRSCDAIFDDTDGLRKHVKDTHLLPVKKNDEKTSDSRNGKWCRCDVCSYECYGPYRLVRHKERSHPERTELKKFADVVDVEFPCNYCSFLTVNAIHLEAHRVRCHPELMSGFPCDVCAYRGRNKYLTDRHREKCHPDYPEPKKPGDGTSINSDPDSDVIYPCHICSFQGVDRAAMDIHWKVEHANTNKPLVKTKKIDPLGGSKLIFPCHLCSFKGSDRSEMEAHLKEGHSNSGDGTPIKKAPVSNIVYPCHLCPFRGSDRATMEDHYEEEHSTSVKETEKSKETVGKRYVCHICKFQTIHPKYMLGHMKTVHQTKELAKDSQTYSVPRGSEIQPGVIVQNDLMFLQIPIADPQIFSDQVVVRFEIEDEPLNEQSTLSQPAHFEPDPISTSVAVNGKKPIRSRGRSRRVNPKSDANRKSDANDMDIVICDYFTGVRYE